MTELIRLLLEVWEKIWPLKRVKRWEMGVELVWGWHWRNVGPGIYPVLPFFMDLFVVSIAPKTFCLPLQFITLRDKQSLNFSATIDVQVVDAGLALMGIEHWEETTAERVSGLLGERLGDVDPKRFDPAYGVRSRLLEELREEADKLTRAFGVTVRAIRFSNFAVGVRTLRLLAERATILEGKL